MNNVRQTLQLAAARTHYMVARAFGIQVTYTNRGAAITGLYAIPETDTAQMRMTLGTRSRELTASFTIAQQTNASAVAFPPAGGCMEDDTITDDQGIVYAIRQEDPDDIGAIYKFTCVSTITKQSGQVGQ